MKNTREVDQVRYRFVPTVFQANITEHRAKMDKLCLFVSEGCSYPNERIQVSGLYHQYINWCRSSSELLRTKVQCTDESGLQVDA